MTEITINTTDLLSVQQFAKSVGYHRYQIYRWIKSGKITAVKLGGVLFIPAEQVNQLKGSPGEGDPLPNEGGEKGLTEHL